MDKIEVGTDNEDNKKKQKTRFHVAMVNRMRLATWNTNVYTVYTNDLPCHDPGFSADPNRLNPIFRHVQQKPGCLRLFPTEAIGIFPR